MTRRLTMRLTRWSRRWPRSKDNLVSLGGLVILVTICIICTLQNFQFCLVHLWTDFQSCLALFNVDRIFHIYRPARSPKSSYQDATIFSILSLERETQWMKLFSTHTLVFIKPSFHNKENRYNNPTI